ncbi:MAG: PadR family transcriptional regulator [Candidatus Cloacimonetes bacterium]|nr:PadR family transcriptional regulator [Candidatus Cloacimonadota bacterium]
MSNKDNKIEAEMNRGFLQIMVLLALENPMYGYMMIRFIENIGYSVVENTLYPMLRRFEKNGWISSSWDVKHDRPKKYYEITNEGKTVRNKLLRIWQKQNGVITKLLEEVKNG